MRNLVLLVFLLVGCGSSSNPPTCNGTSCSCPAQSSCDLGNSGCSGDSCTLACTDGSTCTGSCGKSCSVSCAANSTCDLTVGASGSVNCAANSSCTIHCAGSCSMSCAAGANCELQCASDSAPHAVTASGACT